MAEEIRLGLLIQRARQRKRMTQAELADALGVHRVSVARWEIDYAFPRQHAGAVEEILGITIPEPEPAEPEPAAEATA